jgi:hypothetical protein
MNDNTEQPTRYANYPNHPLYRIRQAVLDTARLSMSDTGNVIEPDLVDPIADMLVMDMLPWLKPEAFTNE